MFLFSVSILINSIKLEIDLQKSVSDADLVIESMSENLKDKQEFYTKLAPFLPEKTIVVTNSSTLLPSKLSKYTKRENKFYCHCFVDK